MPTAYELERAANIARNKALLEELELKEAVASISAPVKKTNKTSEKKAKPIQPRKSAVKREAEDVEPRRQSARLRRTATGDPDETPAQKRKREKEIAEREAKEAEEQLLAEEAARAAKRPRHQDLDFEALAENFTDSDELPALRTSLSQVLEKPHPRAIGDRDAFVFDDDEKEDAELTELKEKMKKLKVVSRAKVTQDRIYSGAYHPETTKDLIFFGDKHGQLGIWDAQAPPDEDDEDSRPLDEREGGKYWRLQTHWPATSKSSISSIKFDPIDSHSVYTSSYDCTIRQLSFTTGISREIFTTDDILPSCVELAPLGHEMWISDAKGWVTHLDLRQHKNRACSYQLAEDKIGCVSVNPVNPHLLLTASNDRALKIWDARKLRMLAGDTGDEVLETLDAGRRSKRLSEAVEPLNFDYEEVTKFLSTRDGKGAFRGEWRHDRAVGSAYWDPHGKRIVSTSYDDQLRVWDFTSKVLGSSGTLPSMRPAVTIKHNTQSGRWVTPLKAQWTLNADVYPHFTVGNMNHTLDIFSCQGELIARLGDKAKITAVQAVTLSHPSIVERAASGNASGRCVLWAPLDADEEVEEEANEKADEE